MQPVDSVERWMEDTQGRMEDTQGRMEDTQELAATTTVDGLTEQELPIIGEETPGTRRVREAVAKFGKARYTLPPSLSCSHHPRTNPLFADWRPHCMRQRPHE